MNAECNTVNKFCTLVDPNGVLWDVLSLAAMNSYNDERQRDSTRAVACLSLPGEQDRNTLSIFPHHFPVDSLIFPQSLVFFFLILVFRVGGLPTQKDLCYATGFNQSEDKNLCTSYITFNNTWCTEFC